MANQKRSFQDVIEEMKLVKGFCDRIRGFRVSDSVIGDWKRAAQLFETGKEAEAVEVGQKPIVAIRAILSAFIRNSVFPKPVSEGETPRIPYFIQLINERDADGYDDDLIVVLRKTAEELGQAVRTETNGSFEQRAVAYAAIQAAIDDADAKQKLRDNKRQHGDWNVIKAKKKAIDDAADKSGREAAVIRRQEMLAERKRQADAAREIF